MTFEEVIEQSRIELGKMVESGTSAIGFFYPHAPYELILAHGFVPTLLRTDTNVTGAYETSLQTFACSLARNIYSQRELAQLPELAGIVFPGNTCDSLQNLGDIWRIRFPEDNVFRLTYPVADYGMASKKFLMEELKLLSQGFSDVLEHPFSDEEFRKAIDFMKSFRESAQTLYAARLLNPQLISYSSLASLVRGFLHVPSQAALDRINTASENVIDESGLEEETKALRKAILSGEFNAIELPPHLSSPRIAILGGMSEPEAIVRIFEILPQETESVIALDILSFGFKTVFAQSPEGDDPYEALADSILSSPGEPTQEGLQSRVKYQADLIKHLNIDGLIICEQSFCDPDEFEAPSLVKAINKLDIPTIRLPLDSELSDLSRLGVRVQSFLETLDHS